MKQPHSLIKILIFSSALSIFTGCSTSSVILDEEIKLKIYRDVPLNPSRIMYVENRAYLKTKIPFITYIDRKLLKKNQEVKILDAKYPYYYVEVDGMKGWIKASKVSYKKNIYDVRSKNMQQFADEYSKKIGSKYLNVFELALVKSSIKKKEGDLSIIYKVTTDNMNEEKAKSFIKKITTDESYLNSMFFELYAPMELYTEVEFCKRESFRELNYMYNIALGFLIEQPIEYKRWDKRVMGIIELSTSCDDFVDTKDEIFSEDNFKSIIGDSKVVQKYHDTYILEDDDMILNYSNISRIIDFNETQLIDNFMKTFFKDSPEKAKQFSEQYQNFLDKLKVNNEYYGHISFIIPMNKKWDYEFTLVVDKYMEYTDLIIYKY